MRSSPSTKIFIRGQLCVFIMLAASVYALPLNEDMVDVQPKTGQLARPKPEGSVPVGGSLAAMEKDRAAVLALQNPVTPDTQSLSNGERIFQIQCSVCHGTFDETGGRTSGPISQFVPGAPDLSSAEIAAKPDGHFFQYIHFGGIAVMPVYGFKLSAIEHWDIVNYLRAVQHGRGN